MAPDKSMEEQLNWAVGKRNVTKSGAIGVKLIAPFFVASGQVGPK